MADQPILQVRGLRKSFGPLEVLKGIDLDVAKGEVVCVIGAVFFLCLFPLVQATYALERRLGRSDD